MKTHADLRLRAFVGSVFLLAIVALPATIHYRPVAFSWALAALVIVGTAADFLAVQVASVDVSISYPVCAAAILLFGPTAGGLACGLSAIPGAFTIKERPVLKGLLNFGQLTLAGLAAGWAYVGSGGRALALAPLHTSEIPGLLIPLFLLAVAYFVVNTTIVGVCISLDTGIPFVKIWRTSFAWTIPTQAAMTALALALAQVVASVGVVGIALLAVPLMVARQVYERYVRLKGTYADTIRSLVAVIEKKDAYTRGHSERVAAYAVAIAQQIGLSESRVERLELAGLLHDLGKVGISRSILNKNGRLEPEEFRLIQQHPAIGARIVESVPFLVDLVPLIADHHERLDGGGYGKGLQSDAITLDARIMSVADAFDAMTSCRSYRPPLSRSTTVAELDKGRGGQFDSDCVDALLSALKQGELQWPDACAEDEEATASDAV
jgi:putative nucleotidyltransferase with HDIG domain